MDRVVIEAFNDQHHAEHAGRCEAARACGGVLDFLNKIEPAGPSDSAAGPQDASRIKSSGKGIVMLLSDFMDKGGYKDALRYLIARQFDVFVVQSWPRRRSSRPSSAT